MFSCKSSAMLNVVYSDMLNLAVVATYDAVVKYRPRVNLRIVSLM